MKKPTHLIVGNASVARHDANQRRLRAATRAVPRNANGRRKFAGRVVGLRGGATRAVYRDIIGI